MLYNGFLSFGSLFAEKSSICFFFTFLLFKNTFKFCFELQKCIPNADVLTRKGIPLKKVVKQAKSSEYTDLIVVHEDRKSPSNFCPFSVL